MTNDKNCDIHHIIYLIINIKNIFIHTMKKIFSEQYILITQ
jgi:hypothetical protein